MIGMLAFVGMLLAACGTPTPTANSLNIQFTTNPEPPRVGDVEYIVTVQDSSGKAVEGAQVHVSANMTSMNMGLMTGVATDQGSGRYALKTKLAQSGEWKFTIQVDKPGIPQGIKEVKLDVN
jgi:hypothetical protein